MTAAAFAAAGQALAETLMDSQGTVVRNGPLGPPDPVTGVVAATQTRIYPAADSPVPAGPMRVKPYSRITGSGVTAGEARDSMVLYTVSIPITVTAVRPGDIVHVTASADPQLLTRTTFRVVGVGRSPQITARRMTCELVEDRTP